MSLNFFPIPNSKIRVQGNHLMSLLNLNLLQITAQVGGLISHHGYITYIPSDIIRIKLNTQSFLDTFTLYELAHYNESSLR